MLKYAPPPVFRYWGISSGDLDQDIDTLVTMRRCWHAGERYVGTRAPATKHVSVRGSRMVTHWARNSQFCHRWMIYHRNLRMTSPGRLASWPSPPPKGNVRCRLEQFDGLHNHSAQFCPVTGVSIADRSVA